MKKFLRQYILPTFVWTFYRLWASTWRFYISEPPSLKDEQRPFILAHWHGDELAVMPLIKKYRLATMTSTSKDGTLVEYLVKKLDGKSSKGSSTRGAVSALKGLVRLGRQGSSICIAVDGPKGPIHRVKPGVFELSKLTRSKIYPVGVYVENPYVFKKSWNAAIFPKPFSKIYVSFGLQGEETYSKELLRSGHYAAELEKNMGLAKKAACTNLIESPPKAEKIL